MNRSIASSVILRISRKSANTSRKTRSGRVCAPLRTITNGSGATGLKVKKVDRQDCRWTGKIACPPLSCRDGLSPGGDQLAQHERQDAAVLVVLDLDRGIDA